MDEEWLTIGQVAARAGLAPSALRFYETEGLIRARRSGGGQRRFHRDVLRRIAFVRCKLNSQNFPGVATPRPPR